ncbi:aldehyde dehydrogenase [Maribacter thermophilus]|uniref:aldehyde dehydrogenase n=1 Tax=Maribacter thermophilus TaxID=1197874 RepID=UPI000640EAEA|nr:aldehyde dehydrogenase [Maribacter thermophilus]
MIESLVEKQRNFFLSGKTKDVKFRKIYLKKLRKAIIDYEDDVCTALYNDFKKPKFEAMASETQFALSELNHAIENIEEWSGPKRVSSTWVNFPSADYIYSQPYGNTLIIAPWNYPFLLIMSPLIGALAAGNTAVVKPSELTPNTSQVIENIIKTVFDEEYVCAVQGGVDISQKLLSNKWDYIFFTGSTKVGKIVYKSAAEHLTPVTLELGGKNPCIVDESALVQIAAKRIAWGKFLNAGQTCIAPDYILVHKNVKEKLVNALKKSITGFFGENIESSTDFARITTQAHYENLKSMLRDEEILFGGDFNDDTLFLSPTLVNEPTLNSKIMEGEIFGPLLPIISYETEKDISRLISNYDKPLALYVFSKKKKFQEKIIDQYSFGGGTINDTVIQITNSQLPFGGIGSSGVGHYQGKHSFDIFSHKKAIIKKGYWPELPLRYAPYNIPLQFVKKLKYLFR